MDPPPNDGSEWWKPGHPWLHETTANDFRAWLAYVEQLTEAARRVYDATPTALPDGTELMLAINGVAAMLIGYATECALKGLWLRVGNKLMIQGKFLRPRNAGDHELGQLARAVSEHVDLSLTSADLNVLDRLSAFVLYAGRYPAPLISDKMRPTRNLSGGAQVPSFFTNQDFNVANDLLRRLTGRLKGQRSEP